MPFPLTGMLGFYVRGAANASAAQLGELEIQMEGSSPGRYTYTRSLSLADILSAQAGGSAAAAAQVLDGMASGRWTAVKTPLAAFAPPAAAADAGAADGAAAGASPFRADRLTIGVCLQRLDRCSAASGVLELCLDKLVLVGGR